ncbi:MAG: flagellar basal body rod protein FlgC [Nitrospirales bacterium]|nr:flagellar basal body rod protein FlgC [Nitrospira sp.]MDR4502270.1 flagellar basal body rod protein FlgC [Nitrospirales bacterium]
MNVNRLFHVVGSALNSQRQRLNIIAGNLANAESTRAPNGGPYVRRDVVFRANVPSSPFATVFSQAFGRPAEPHGVKIEKLVFDQRPPREVYDPHHPDADSKGYLHLPNVNVIEEMTNMLSASRAYEANLAVLETGKSMTMRALQMGQ